MAACLICEICETPLDPDFDATLPCPKCGTKDRFRLGTRQPEPTQTGKRSAIARKRPAIAKDAETLLSVAAFEKLKAAIRLAGPGAVDLLKDAGNDPDTKAAFSVVAAATEADLAEYQQELQARDEQALEPTEPAQTRTAVTPPPVHARRRSGCLGAVLVWVFLLILFLILGDSEQEKSPILQDHVQGPTSTSPSSTQSIRRSEPITRTLYPREESAFVVAASINIACQERGYVGAILENMECFPDALGNCERAEITLVCTNSQQEHEQNRRKLQEWALQ